MDQQKTAEAEKIKRERHKLLNQIDKVLEAPMVALGFVWLILVIIELTAGLNSTLEKISAGIWIIFILHFIFTFLIAPAKKKFLKRNVLTIVSLIVPALRILRMLRVLRILRGARLIKIITSVNRSMRGLAITMNRRGFGYMLVLSIFVIFAGAAGMFAFERNEGQISSYSVALWHTALMSITVGSDYWPKTSEGRILCFVIMLYGFAVLGYVTATLATFFIGKDVNAKNKKGELSEIKTQLDEIKKIINQFPQKNKHEKN